MTKKTNLDWFENWIDDDMDTGLVDLVFEYLGDQDMLKVSGKKLAFDFWKKYIEEKP